jgi:hypothetical protein
MSAANANSTLVPAQLRLHEELTAHRILANAIAFRPKQTKKCFVKKQEEFIKWACMKGYPQPETVTEEEQVVGRLNQNDSSQQISKPTIDQYISALTSLWKDQVEQKVNAHPTPRGILVKHIRNTFSQNINKVRKATHYDCGLLHSSRKQAGHPSLHYLKYP